jgi:outer membrane lipoprotein-sorting protein
LVVLAPSLVSAQDIQTAENFFDRVAESYGEVKDYIADFSIQTEKSTMSGTLFYKSPNLLRIDFITPAEQVVVSDGEKLTVYIPQYRVIMNQTLRKRSSAALAALASQQGLHLLKRNYSVAYLEGPAPVSLDNGGDEKVTKLKLTWRSSDEGFRQIEMSVSPRLIIRRMVGLTLAYQKVQFDFKNVRINQSIPDARFKYNAPATANVVENFLFDANE